MCVSVLRLLCERIFGLTTPTFPDHTHLIGTHCWHTTNHNRPHMVARKTKTMKLLAVETSNLHRTMKDHSTSTYTKNGRERINFTNVTSDFHFQDEGVDFSDHLSSGLDFFNITFSFCLHAFYFPHYTTWLRHSGGAWGSLY